MVRTDRRAVPGGVLGAALGPLPAGLGSAGWHPVPLCPPQSLDALAVDRPPFGPKERADPPVAVAGMGRGEDVHPIDELDLVLGGHPLVALGRAVLADEQAGPTFRDWMATQEVGDGIPAPGRAHHFPRWRSLSMEMSRACSATIRLSRAFSCSKAFSRYAGPRPPQAANRLAR